MKSKTKFKWHCPHCNHRNSAIIDMQFEVPKQYNALWDCDECGETSNIELSFKVHGWSGEKKEPKLRKKKQKKKKLKCKHNWVSSTDHPGGELYWKCKRCNETKEFTEQNYKDEDIKITKKYRNDLRRRGLGIKKNKENRNM